MEKIIIYIFLFIITCYVLNFIYQLSNYFHEKRNYQFIINKKESQMTSNMTMLDRVDSTINILQLTNNI